MTKVIFDAGISLDGFSAGDNRGPDNPLGDNGQSIHQWMYRQKAFWKQLGEDRGTEEGPDNDLIAQTFARSGAYVMGKRMFDEGEVSWPEDLYKALVFVLTHEQREPWQHGASTTFHFVDTTIEDAVEQAKAAAGGKDVRIQGGANVIQQALNAGIVDEFTVHVAPVVIGSGIRLFDGLDRGRFSVEATDVVPSRGVTHLHYTVTNKS